MYLTDQNIKEMAKGVDRLTPCLVRMSQCRFLAPVQDVTHIIAALEAAGDHCRDVELKAGGSFDPLKK